MIYLVYSDVHGNLEALEAFFAVAESIVHDKKVCLGDIVGYGADPNSCIELVRGRTDVVLAGNHDYAVVGKTDLSYFNAYAYEACVWTGNVLTREGKDYLKSLPAIREEDEVCWAHASPFEPEEWHYIFSLPDALNNFHHFKAPVCFTGHTHRPVIFAKGSGDQVEAFIQPVVELQPGYRYIINVGSLGQPRDGNPDPVFAIYDTESARIVFRRFHYDLAATQRKIMENGLPPYLAERLAAGW
jgi:diadenosine tetraphosphatase ApaH/serine/threonine PP2A family protein phosphatase